MKTRILPLIGLTFSGLLLARAISVSSEVLPAKNDSHDGATVSAPAEGKDANVNSSGQSSSQTENTGEDLCLTGAVLDVLQNDKAQLKKRLAVLEAREKALQTLEDKLSEQMTVIDEANRKMEAQIIEMKTVANDDILHLVKMYQTMKPKQAAAIFESMDPGFAAGFLREMSGERAGLIMANMDSRKSYAISILMAAKNSNYR